MAADPKFTPVTDGWMAGEVWPAGMVTDAGTVATFGLLLERFTVTADVAAEDRVTESCADWPGAKVGFVDNVMTPADCTVIVAIPFEIFGRVVAEAVTVAVPAPTLLMGTITLVVPATIWTDCGTPTTPDGLAFRLTVTPPAGAGADSVSVGFVVPAPTMVAVPGLKLRAAVTETTWLADP
jgi:hypothetical protein